MGWEQGQETVYSGDGRRYGSNVNTEDVILSSRRNVRWDRKRNGGQDDVGDRRGEELALNEVERDYTYMLAGDLNTALSVNSDNKIQKCQTSSKQLIPTNYIS